MLVSFALPSLLRNKTRTGLTVLGLAVAIMGVVSLLSISEGLRTNVLSSLEKTQLVIVTKEDISSPTMSSLDASTGEEIEKVSGVRDVLALTIFPASLSETSYTRPTFVIGIDPSEEKKMRDPLISNYLTSGGMFASSSSSQVVISKKLADKYEKKVGSTIELSGKKFRIAGISDPRVSILQNAVIMPMDTASALSGRGEDAVSSFYVEPENPAEVDALARRIELSVEGVSAKSASEMAGTVSGLITQLDAFFLLISSFSIIVGGLIVMNTMYMNVIDRTKEIGVLRAMGWTKDDVIKEMVQEAVLIGVLVGFTGVLMSYLLKYAVLNSLLSFNTQISVSLALFGIFMAIIISLMGGVYPAVKAAGIEPVTAIREE